MVSRALHSLFAIFLFAFVGLGVVATPSAAQDAAATEAAEARSDVDLLIDVIEDDTARAELIERLRAVDGQAVTPGEVVDEMAPGAPPPDDLSFGRQVALITQEVAEGIAGRLTTTWAQLSRSSGVLDGLSGAELGVLLDALRDLALIIAGTVVVYIVLRRLGKALYARMGASARDGGALRTVVLFLASALIDAGIVIVAWAVGYAIAVLFLGEFGQIGIRQTLYLNAFLLVEMTKVVVRMVLSPSAANLRPLPVTDGAARYLATRLNLIVGLVGYGQLLVVPVINSNVSFAAGRAVSSLIAFAVLALAIWLVLRNRRAVTDWMLGSRRRTAPAAAEPRAETAARPANEESRPRGADRARGGRRPRG
ncbi:hypothetical protein [Salipiger mucosus]|uniref:Potassium efflux system KefA protein / Small-conductance mechanosensitive channel n=1 Tax=Salipiger mucosus DSM 16094 TaxID=1123237 RepID=S9SKA8_9RHOB|nr:Potassium efflux system KefA protein / Small-conductance mechanosensitive channel [Salipiger mucosus DSM 16094]